MEVTGGHRVVESAATQQSGVIAMATIAPVSFTPVSSSDFARRSFMLV